MNLRIICLMKTMIQNMFAILIIILLLPYVFTVLFQGNMPETKLKKANLGEETCGKWIELKQSGQKEKVDVEEYLIGMVAATVPIEYADEALKAQAVIARTHIMQTMNGADIIDADELNQDYKSMEELQNTWGYAVFQENYERLKKVVSSTHGQVLMYNKQIIYAPFHAVSAGYTRSGNEIAKKEVYPYLQSVKSAKDVESQDFLNVKYVEKSVFAQKLADYEAKIQVSEEAILSGMSIMREEPADYVQYLHFEEFNLDLTGEEVREIFGLNSSCFTMDEFEGKVRFITKGLGHGIGLSQYGANQMAAEEKTYQEILKYYYSDTEITNIYE